MTTSPKDTGLRERLSMELIPKFTDDYIDEWVRPGNDIEGLHIIIDSFADELVDLFKAYLTELEGRLNQPSRLNTDFDRGYDKALEHVRQDIKTFREGLR